MQLQIGFSLVFSNYEDSKRTGCPRSSNSDLLKDLEIHLNYGIYLQFITFLFIL